MTADRQTYVPEIDGLRAIAVLAVILFHLQVSGLAGGFVGVDVFFVISGYLITTGLQRELSQHGTVRFGHFYLRRARRLLPALYAVLLLSSLAAVVFLSHHRLPQFGASLVAAALSLSNVQFFLGSGYFDTSSDYKPLLHTWSLGVEEQFYLIWPMLMWLTWRRRWQFLAVSGAVFASSLLAAEWSVHSVPSAAFFLVPFRMYEFAIGSVLATSVPRTEATSWRVDGSLLLGLVLVVGAVLAFGPRTSFPGWLALLPCMGAALILWAAPASRFKPLLNNSVMRYLGRTSYSTYLVHWPLIVMYRIAKGREHLRPREQAILFVLTIVLGHLLHRYIENRYRGKSHSTDRRFLLGLLLVTLVLLGAGLAVQVESWVMARSWAAAHISPKEIEVRRNERFSLSQQICKVKGRGHCDDLVAGKRNALVIGDSHAVDAYNAFVTRFPNDNLVLSDLGGCPPHRAIDTIVLASHPDLPRCLELNRKRHDPAFLRQFDYLVINVYLDWYREEHLSEYLRFLHQAGVRHVIVFGQTWRAPDDLPELVNRVGFEHARLMTLLTSPPSDRLVADTAQQLGYVYVSKTEALSTQGAFDVFDAKEVLFTYDQHHLSLPHATRLLDQRLADVTSYLETRP